MRVIHARAALLGTVAAAAFIATPAVAQVSQAATEAPKVNAGTQDQASTASDQEIVVTARRRSELLLDVPVSVTAYSGEQLNRQGALDISDISDTTPNVNLETSRGTNSTLTAFIRGVGQQDPVAGFEQGVAGADPRPGQRQQRALVGRVFHQPGFDPFRLFFEDLGGAAGRALGADQRGEVDRPDGDEKTGAHQQRENRVDDADDVLAPSARVEHHPPLAARCHPAPLLLR